MSGGSAGQYIKIEMRDRSDDTLSLQEVLEKYLPTAKIITLTDTQYAALAVKDPKVVYVTYAG